MTKIDSSLRDYYRLTKPGIIRGNLLTAIGGFFLASQGRIHCSTLLWLLLGMSLVIGSACVCNNIYDRDIDSKMARTRQRALVAQTISSRQALVFGVIIGLGGIIMLFYGTNTLTTVLGVIGFVTYVGVYTPAKHRTPYATLLGTIPGALPPVAGYTTVLNRLDLAALLLFVILVAWQMPHFYAIAIRRLDDYKAAGVPVWPAFYTITATRQQMIAYGLLFSLSCLALAVQQKLGLFGLVMVPYSLFWLTTMRPGPKDWAKRCFLWSLPALPLFSGLLIAQYL